MGQNAPAGNLQMVYRLGRSGWLGHLDRLEASHEVQEKDRVLHLGNNLMHCPTLGIGWLYSSLAEIDFGGLPGRQAEHEPAMHPCGKKTQQHPGLH